MRTFFILNLIAALMVASIACPETAPDSEVGGGQRAEPAATTTATPEGPRQRDSFDTSLRLDQAWSGDLDGMVERGVIRALVVYSMGLYFLDGATQRGITYELLSQFEDFVNQRLGRTTLKVRILIIPVQRDELFSAVAQGLGDIAAANLTITQSRLETVDFSNPLMTGVSEVLVTGSGGDDLRSLDDLSGRELHVRRSSSYWQSLERLNDDLRRRGLEPVRLTPAEEFLQDEDLLEMVNAGLLPAIVVDSHKARFWAQIFDRIRVHEDVTVRTGGRIAWAFRKESPQLAELVNAFVAEHKKGTLLGNILLNRYLKDTRRVRTALADEDRARFEHTVGLFEKYGQEYGFDHLLLTALAYQESQLDHSARSAVGAVGIMQLLPSTAADPNVGIPDITALEDNIHAGAKYLRFLRDRYFSAPGMAPLDQTLFTFAAYNAGPARVRRLRAEARDMGLDPNVWFGNVEHVAARRIGRETVHYVSNITKYYVAYKLATGRLQARASEQAGPRDP